MEWSPVYHVKGWGKFNRHYGDFCTGADTNIAAQEIGVDTILSWTQDEFVAPTRREPGESFRFSMWRMHFLQVASVNAADCDVVFEISMTPDKNAPQVIVETPVDSEFCSARQNA
jgi:hypothetical protein